MNMPGFDEGEDVFFDSYESVRTSIDSGSSEGYVIDGQGLELEKFERAFWAEGLISVQERRNRFLREMGLDGFESTPRESPSQGSTEDVGLERITQSSGAVLDSLSSGSCGVSADSHCCIRDLDSGKRFIIQDSGEDGLFNTLREVGSERLITLQEFEMLLGLSSSVQRFMQRVTISTGEKLDKGLDEVKNKSRRWWKHLVLKNRAGMCKADVAVRNSRLPRTMRTRVQQHCKRCLEFTALYMGQEIQAHKGLIWVMRFNPSGTYLASGGEDCVVRVWKVGEVESSCKCFAADESYKLINKLKDKKFKLGGKDGNRAPLFIPKKVFKIEETALQELRGHTGEILDISWSTADCLLTSSEDKTVRLWKVGSDRCLKVFQHNDYVTCIQFNPVDDRYFISGSIDGKVRVWGISENRVVDWADMRDIVTAVCYRPDGKGFVVGSIAGNCRFYDCSDNTILLDKQFCVQGRKKSSGKRITGLQFSPEAPERVMITSADSKVRIFDGSEVIRKFRGLRKTKSHLSASFSSDGRYIVSVGEDSHIYIWNCGTSGLQSSKGVKFTRSSDRFFSEGVSVAVPWPGNNGTGASLGGSNRPPSSSPPKVIDPSNLIKDSERCYLGTLFFLDSLSRASATWPEEELHHSSKQDNHYVSYHQDRCTRCAMSLSATWDMAIVTASSDGTIRSFLNYGLPVRL